MVTSARVRALGQNFFDRLDRQVASARATGRDILDLSKGNPDLATPPHIVEALRQAVGLSENQAYPPFRSKRSVREAIALRYREDYGIDLDPDTQVTAFHGAHEALMALPQALLNPGDELIVADPCYPPYLDAARLAGVRVRRLPVEETAGFLPEVTRPDVVGDAGVILLNYPNNPTGAVADEGFWAAVVAAAGPARAIVVNDFAYSSLDFGRQRAVSVFSADPNADLSLEIGTLSKTYSMAGWRFGYAVGNADAIDALVRYQTVVYSTIFGAVQDAAEVALRSDQSSARAIAEEYRVRRDAVAVILREGGWHVGEPKGTFFLWVHSPRGCDGETLAGHLLDDAGVVVAPGIGFGEAGRDWVRISLVHDRPTLEHAAHRLADWLRAAGEDAYTDE